MVGRDATQTSPEVPPIDAPGLSLSSVSFSISVCAEADGLRRLALLLRRGQGGDGGGGGAEAVAERLKMSNAEKRRLAAMVEPTVAVAAGLDVRARRRALYRVGSAPFADLVYLAWAEALARAPEDRVALARAHGAMIETAREWESPRLPVRGADVVALGVKRGPAVSRLLAAVEEWWEAGDYRASRPETLKKLGELVKAARTG